VCVTGACSARVVYSFNRLVEVPRIFGVIPSSGPTRGGTVIRVIGEHFRSEGTVAFVDVDASLTRMNASRPCAIVSYTPSEIR
jgi:hypothetical protein